MSERKVLNKYYPPDFDPTKLPKLKRGRNRQFVIRIMAPFSMRCKTCGEYIYKGRKFNSRMETVENENYLGLRIYRFYIRCTKCISEITFKTDPENTDYVMEHGATRNFESFKKLTQQIEKANKDREDEEANNPMKALENRTRDSKREMESAEKLEELRDLNQRVASIDPEKVIADHLLVGQKMIEKKQKKQEEEDEMLVRQMFGSSSSSSSADGYISRIIDDGSDDSEEEKAQFKKDFLSVGKRAATDIFVEDAPCSSLTLSSNTMLLPDESIGPSANPKKTKLKTPFDELASMVVMRKKKRKSSEDAAKEAKDEAAKESKESKAPVVEKPNEPTPLPAYKIMLKKQVDNSKAKMKGTSLNLLGGYDSGSSSNDDNE